MTRAQAVESPATFDHLKLSVDKTRKLALFGLSSRTALTKVVLVAYSSAASTLIPSMGKATLADALKASRKRSVNGGFGGARAMTSPLESTMVGALRHLIICT